jgi:hypothetical protein
MSDESYKHQPANLPNPPGEERPSTEPDSPIEESASPSAENERREEGQGLPAHEAPDSDSPFLSDDELNEVIEHLCESKAEEFRMIGYEHVTGREIWDCVSEKYRKTGVPPLHQIVNDILSLKSTQFMNWMTMSIYKKAQF